jgi:hypothetical protein
VGVVAPATADGDAGAAEPDARAAEPDACAAEPDACAADADTEAETDAQADAQADVVVFGSRPPWLQVLQPRFQSPQPSVTGIRREVPVCVQVTGSPIWAKR